MCRPPSLLPCGSWPRTEPRVDGFRWVGVNPQSGWFIRENPINMDDLGYPPILGNLYIWWAFYRLYFLILMHALSYVAPALPITIFIKGTLHVLHTYNTIIRTIQSYVQYNHTYNTIIHTIQYNTIQYNTITLQYSTLHYTTLHYITYIHMTYIHNHTYG